MRPFRATRHAAAGGKILLYLICFTISIILLLILVSYEKAVDIHMTILAVLITVVWVAMVLVAEYVAAPAGKEARP